MITMDVKQQYNQPNPVPGRPTSLITVGQGPIALAEGAGGGGLDIFFSHLSFLLFLPLFGRWPDIG